MLELKNIKKVYQINDFKQNALNGVSLKFRQNEFVSILGQSGSGKTTLLNIVGGLDAYDNGDLIINGISTKKYKDIDWDTYRNHRVGFVFQSYNLITHQSVLSNVELALTISGISSKERRERALKVLKEVGLKDHVNKKPNQLSGGQMQRVAIARALINNPDILLADEPTGALDSETSEQIMALLKKIAEEKLVIMVTHNPELAEEYSTRIVRLLDGNIVSDSKPFKGDKKESNAEDKKNKTFMSFKTALSLSFNNLLTKKGRTIMTAFAGSIGIIGIATILSLSNGVQKYIDDVERDTLASYPILLEEETVDPTSMIAELSQTEESDIVLEDGYIFSNDMMVEMMSLMSSQMQSNNLENFKNYIEKTPEFEEYTTAINYSYNLELQIYENSEEVVKINPNDTLNSMMMQSPMMGTTAVWQEMIGGEDFFKEHYNLVDGAWPEEYNEVVLLVDENNQISDYTLYALGLKDPVELEIMMQNIMSGKEVEEPVQMKYSYEELLDLNYKLVLNTDYYEKSNNKYIDQSENETYMEKVLEDAEVLNIVGIVKLDEDSNLSSMNTGGVFYTKDLTNHVINKINESDIAKEQLENPEVNVITGQKFEDSEGAFDINSLSDEEKYQLSLLSQEELAKVMQSYSDNAGATYDTVLDKLGINDLSNPSSISLYSKDFESKELIEGLINDYNEIEIEAGRDENKISYTDYIGLLLSSVTTIIDMITYVLIAFVSISLIVSSIMIGIITYISVLERTKEIGILRAIGASKKDISRVFNAETFIVGLFSGTIGILVTLIINVIANIIIFALTDVANLARLPLSGGIVLIIISVILTMIAGLIPSKMASNKNPVEALRTE